MTMKVIMEGWREFEDALKNDSEIYALIESPEQLAGLSLKIFFDADTYNPNKPFHPIDLFYKERPDQIKQLFSQQIQKVVIKNTEGSYTLLPDDVDVDIKKYEKNLIPVGPYLAKFLSSDVHKMAASYEVVQAKEKSFDVDDYNSPTLSVIAIKFKSKGALEFRLEIDREAREYDEDAQDIHAILAFVNGKDYALETVEPEDPDVPI
jgi:hypothetical protein